MILKKHLLISLSILAVSIGCAAQPLKNTKPYSIEKDRLLYTVGYAHLDTEWNWDYPTTINELILNTMTENFRLFEKYPCYVFNFTGSRRYNMMKEYYPSLYKKVQHYVQEGRWHVSGSSVDEGEVNISSSESLIRQILYGNRFFFTEFGKESADYMLPDCFGFLSNLPTVFNHCGLLGFSTQKLTWRSAAGVPFNVGVWNGPDEKGVIAALNATDYGGTIEKRLDKDDNWTKRLNEDKTKTGYAFDYRYYGVGDEGGAPREIDVKNVIASQNNSDENFRVLLTSSDQMYKDITPEIRQKLPIYSGELLLIEHSAGSMTSQSFMKRMNRKNELLAQSSEMAAVYADLWGRSEYPFGKLNSAWDLILGSQFHDILPGTSIPEAYNYAWNDEFIAANNLAEVLKNSVGSITATMNTKTIGRPIVVYNPVPQPREDIVSAELEYCSVPASVAVYDYTGKQVPAQIAGKNANKLKILFQAKMPPAGIAIFEVRENGKATEPSSLNVTKNSLENEYYKIRVADNGDIYSIFDKKTGRELLKSPARLEFLKESPAQWAAWNMDWKDRQHAAIDYLNQDAALKVIENGPVRVAIEVRRKGLNSEVLQYYSLAAGEAGKRFEVTNKIDWQSRGVSLKASFPLTASNEKATYNLGVSTISRSNNHETQFEVPSKEWFDLTDKSGRYGVSILEDCKFGSDKPDDNTLRLTLLYTPEVNWKWLTYQSTQDWGIHDVKYAVFAHKGNCDEGGSAWQGKFFNQPLLAFEAPKHEGENGKTFSMLSISNPTVGLMAYKKMETGDYYLVRFNELTGKDQKTVKVKFPADIADAYEVNGQEKKIAAATVKNNELVFDLSHFTIRSFAVRLKTPSRTVETLQTEIVLPYNADFISADTNRWDATLSKSYPAELLPETIISENIHFRMGDKTDEALNAVSCTGQTIQLPNGKYKNLYLLGASLKDKKADFILDGKKITVGFQPWTGTIGQFYNRLLSRDKNTVEQMEEPFVKMDNIAWFASHCHNAYPMKNLAYQYCYLYKYEIPIPEGAKTITLPIDKDIYLFAMTAATTSADAVTPLQALYDNFDGNPSFVLRKKN